MFKVKELFPATNLVNCVFAFRQNNSIAGTYSKYDCLTEAAVARAKRYMYRVPEYLRGELKVGDAVVVHCRTGFQLVSVAEINAISSYSEESFAPVVCKVDLHSYFDEIDAREPLQAMRNKIESEKKRLDLLAAYKAAGGEF